MDTNPVTPDFCNGLSAAEMLKLSLRESMDLNGHDRREEPQTVCSVAARVLALEQLTGTLSKALEENTLLTKQVLEIVQAARKVGRVSVAIGRAAAWTYKWILKFIAPMAVGFAALLAVYQALRGIKT